MIIYEDGEMFNVPSQWLAEHDKQIRNEVIEKFVAECNLRIHEEQMQCEDDGIDCLSIEDIRDIAEQMKGEQNELGN